MKEEKESVDFVKWFSELNKDSGNVAGGKGANLAEIYNFKIPVPPGFVVTAQAYRYFINKVGIDKKIKDILKKINYDNTKELDNATSEIRRLITDSKFPKEMEEEILEAYETLGVKEDEIKSGSAYDILKNAAEPIFVAVRSSATTEDLAEASFAGQQDSFVNVKGNNQLIENIKKCFASLFTSRATYYRNKNGFADVDAALAVVVQKMVDSDKSGVIFSVDPNGKNDNIIVDAVFGLGEGIVSGRITPDDYIVSRDLEIIKTTIAKKKIAITRNSNGENIIVNLREEKSNSQVLKDYEIKRLAEFAKKLEEHYKKPQDIEFAIEGEDIFIVQTRPITTSGKKEEDAKEISGEAILEGIPASPGIGSGKIRIINNLEDLHKINQGDVLVTKMTNPDMVVSMQKSVAIVTDEGGMTAHAAIVSREMGIPAVVGTEFATTKLKEGEVITVDGYHGKIYKGKTTESVKKEISPVNVKTKTEMKIIVDLPSFASRAAQSKIKKVGLTRIEGIIAESGKHPNYFIKEGKTKEYEDVIFNGINEISKYFEEIWVRTSDIRSDEFMNLEGASKEKEANPMLGMHGIRYGIKNPEVLKSELNALKRVKENGTKIGLLLPQIISVDEVKKVKDFLKEIDFNDAKVGVMIETPAAVQLIRELCEEGISFISFGTNDLTQYILAVDRGNEQVQNLYDEMHPAVLRQIEYVIRVCKRNNVFTSICGQAGSKKEMVEFLVKRGVDSISVNADMASEIANYVLEIENNLVKGTDNEPRAYQSKNEKDSSVEDKELHQGFVKPSIVEEDKKEEGILRNIVEKTEDLIQDKKGEIPMVSSLNNEEQKERIKKDIEEIEKEKQEYCEEHPEEISNEEDLKEDEETNKNNLDNSHTEPIDEEPEFNEENMPEKSEEKNNKEFLDIF